MLILSPFISFAHIRFKYYLVVSRNMKCEICKKQIPETFLSKLVGTIIKDKKGKKHSVCSECQKKLGSKEEILKTL